MSLTTPRTAPQLPHAARSLRVLSVHNQLSATNIPLEAFAALEDPTVERFVATLYQTKSQARRAVGAMYAATTWQLEGFGWRWHRPQHLVRIARFLRRLQPDVVHVHHACSAAIFAQLARRTTNARVITTLHRNYGTLNRWQRWLLNHALHHSDVVLCNSESTRASLLAEHDWACLPRVEIAYNGVDLEAIDRAARRNPPDAAAAAQVWQVGVVGRLLPIKGFDTVLSALDILRRRGRDVRLVLVGDGPERLLLERQAATLQLTPFVRFTGNLPRHEVYRELAAMDLFLASSHAEGFCNAMVEAMAAGCAVVASNIGVFRELLGTDYPHFFPPGDATRLADQLERCAVDARQRTLWGEHLRRRAWEHFSLAACATRHLAIYRQAADDRWRPRQAWTPRGPRKVA